MAETKQISTEDLEYGESLRKGTQEMLYCLWTPFAISKKVKQYLLVINTMRFIQTRISMVRRSVRKSIPIVSLSEMTVTENRGVCKLRLRFSADEEVFEIKTNVYIVTQIVQAMLKSSLNATYLFPKEHLPLMQVPPKYRKGFQQPKLSPRQALVYAYAVACDELDIAERPAVACGLQQTTSDQLNVRKLFFPEGLDVASHPLPQADIQALANTLRFTSCFKDIVCAGVPVADDGLRALCTAVVGNKHITHVSFVDCKVTSGSSMNQIGQTFKSKRPRLKTFNLGNNPKLQDSGITALAMGLGRAHIDQLFLNKCAFRTKGYKNLCTALSYPNLCGENGLKVLDISDNHAGKNGSKSLASWLQKTVALEVLTLVRTDMDSALVLGAIKSNTRLSTKVLKQLNISGCRLHDAGAQVLGSLLSSTQSMARVFVQSTRLSAQQFDYIINGACTNPSASTGNGVQFVLDFSSNGLEDNAGKILTNNLKTPVRSIKTLILSHNNLREMGIISLCKALVNLKSLKTLVIDKNVKSSTFSSGNPDLGKALVRLCQQLPILDTLSINGADDTVYNVKNGLNPLFENLAKNKTLTRLSVNRNGLTDAEILIISKSLMKNTTLRVIDIDNNKGTYASLKEYIKAVKRSESLWEACPRNDSMMLMKSKRSNALELKLGVDEITNRLEANRLKGDPNELAKLQLGGRSGRANSAYAPPPIDSSEEKTAKTPEEMEMEMEKPRGDQFGVELVDIIGTTKIRYLEGRVPTVLVQMWNYLLDHGGVDQVGIFRLAPDADESNLVQRQFNQQTFKSCSDVNSVANCIKIWFRELPTPLLNNVDRKRVAEASTPEKAIEVINTVKEPEKSLLLWLLDCNVIIAANEAVNKMSPRNLAIVFVPNLFQIDNLDPLESLHFSEKVSRLFENGVIFRTEWRKQKDVEEAEEEVRLAEERAKKAEEMAANGDNGSDKEESKDGTYYEEDEEEEEEEEQDWEAEKEEFEKEKAESLKQIKLLIKNLKREQIKLRSEIDLMEIDDEEEVDEEHLDELQMKMREITTEIKAQTERKTDLQAREFEPPTYNADLDKDEQSPRRRMPPRGRQPPPPNGRPPPGRHPPGRGPPPGRRGTPPPGRRRPPPPGRRGTPPPRSGQPPPPSGHPPTPSSGTPTHKYTAPAGQPPPPTAPRPSNITPLRSPVGGAPIKSVPYSPHQPPPPAGPRPGRGQPPPPKQPPPSGIRSPTAGQPPPPKQEPEPEPEPEQEDTIDGEEEQEYDEEYDEEYYTLFDADGNELEYDEDGMLLSEQQYDEEGTAIQGFDEEGNPVYYEQQYDEDGNAIEGYDEDGNPVYPQEYDDEGIPIQGYDEDGNPVYYDEEDLIYEDDGITLEDMLSGDPNDYDEAAEGAGEVYDDEDDYYDDAFENDPNLTEEQKEGKRKDRVREKLKKQREQVGGNNYHGGYQLNINALIQGAALKPLKKVE